MGVSRASCVFVFAAALSSSLLSSALSSALPLLHPTFSGRSRREAGFRLSLPHSQSQHDGHDLHRDDGTPDSTARTTVLIQP
ncbi:hypothetical protein F5148DRAFT_1213690 [Russula earlei]|uniref:Uncharacterized protein n=1 Tax=Russula earlei TaxID=71964 RepID=A0ACC0U436_9AGAM|nr:hypothetical protein F5148DRAFT_1213690 [Russula earlei]